MIFTTIFIEHRWLLQWHSLKIVTFTGCYYSHYIVFTVRGFWKMNYIKINSSVDLLVYHYQYQTSIQTSKSHIRPNYRMTSVSQSDHKGKPTKYIMAPFLSLDKGVLSCPNANSFHGVHFHGFLCTLLSICHMATITLSYDVSTVSIINTKWLSIQLVWTFLVLMLHESWCLICISFLSTHLCMQGD